MHSDLVHTLYGQIDLAPTRDGFENSRSYKNSRGRPQPWVCCGATLTDLVMTPVVVIVFLTFWEEFLPLRAPEVGAVAMSRSL